RPQMRGAQVAVSADGSLLWVIGRGEAHCFQKRGEDWVDYSTKFRLDELFEHTSAAIIGSSKGTECFATIGRHGGMAIAGPDPWENGLIKFSVSGGDRIDARPIRCKEAHAGYVAHDGGVLVVTAEGPGVGSRDVVELLADGTFARHKHG